MNIRGSKTNIRVVIEKERKRERQNMRKLRGRENKAIEIDCRTGMDEKDIGEQETN